MTNTTMAKHPARSSVGGKKVFIPELHGLRGLALALVVAFHLFGNGRVSGGVDVFLFISAFLLTGSLIRSAEKREHYFLSKRYARTFSRLMPPALISLAAVAAGTVLFLPRSQWAGSFTEVIASALYFENYQLIWSRLAYGAAGAGASPLQHFWSLSIQGQFFVVWPIVVYACYRTVRFLNRRTAVVWLTGRRLVLAVTLAATAWSFVHASHLVQVNQQVAYFSSTTRFWQLGLGALVALTLTKVRVPAKVRWYVAWLGVGIILLCGFVIDGLNLFPGPWALVPLSGVILVLVGSGAESRLSVSSVLGVPVVKFIADISYGLYLWHWPILVFYLQFRGRSAVGWQGALGILALSVLIAWFSKRLFDVVIPRIQALGRWKTIALLLLATAVLVAAMGLGIKKINDSQRDLLEQATMLSPDHPGAAALGINAAQAPSNVDIVPAPEVAALDKPELYTRGCTQSHKPDPEYSEVKICEDIYADGAERLRVVMAGGSHVMHWEPAFREIANSEGWELIFIGKHGCRLRLYGPDGDRSNSCVAWNDSVIDVIADLSPDVVITTGTRTSQSSTNETVHPEQVAAWAALGERDIPVLAMRDTPRWEEDIPDCVVKHQDDWSRCGKPRNAAYAELNPMLEQGAVPENVIPIDFTDVLCDAQRCEPVVGNVLVYRDDDHISATYVRTTAPLLREMLQSTVPWMFR